MKSLNVLTNIQIERIQSLVQRFENSVSELKIRNWLEQFEFEEWDIALDVLMKFEYFSSKRMMKQYNLGLKDVFEKIKKFEKEEDEKVENNPLLSKLDLKLLSKLDRQILNHKRKLRQNGKNTVIIHPIGAFGKSSSIILYYVTHAPFFKDNNFKVLKNINELVTTKNIEATNQVLVGNKNNFLHLILIDDFSGSGDSIIDYINLYIKPQLIKENISNIKIYILCIAFMSGAKIRIKEKLSDYSIEFIGSERVAAFSSTGSPFGYRPKMLKVRKFCYNYGENLYTKEDYKKGEQIIYPLGYKNTQALIAFEHTVPNNTLPIIWSVQNCWNPLYPRVISARIKEVEDFKNQTRIWLSLAKELGYENIFGQDKDIYKSESLKLLCYIRLIKKNIIRPIISQKLDLTNFEVDEIIKKGMEKGLFQNENKLTKYGEKLYSELLKKSEFLKETKTIQPSNNIIYVPKSFRGKV